MTSLRSVAFAVFVAVPGLVLAHGGGLDGYGCHNNKKEGGYHCHRGDLAGKSFASKDAMLKELARQQGGKTAPKK